MLSRLRKGLFFLFLKIYISLFAKINGITFKIARTPQELDKIYRLRWDVYIKEKRYTKLEHFPDKIMEDDYDKYSVNFLAMKDKEVIGTVRLVLNSKLGFPIKDYFNIIPSKNLKRKNLAEVSRLAIHSHYRGGLRVVMLGLGIMIYEYSQKHGIKHWYACMYEKLTHSFKKYGLNIKDLKIRELSPENIKARKPHQGYFKNAKAYLINLNINN